MANEYRNIDASKLTELAEQYCIYCAEMQKEVATGKGVQRIKERNIPTIKYFVLHWLKNQGFTFYERQYVYDVLKNESHPLSDTLKKIREYFDSLAEDVVANEQKGIFYAKNRLGMTDKQETKTDGIQKIIIERTSQNTDQGGA